MQTVLIVEDYPAVYYTLEFTLKREGYNVVIADTLVAARKAIHNQTIDLVLLDLNLPDGRGNDLLYHIRKELNLDTPVIVTSATLQSETVHSVLEAGANGYFLKPFDINDLMQLVKHWTSSNVAD